jgi:hypoxanthine phosphoribosyltransferase
MEQKILKHALEKAELIHDRSGLLHAINTMALAIQKDLEGQNPVFVTVMGGALIMSGFLALQLPFDCQFDYVHATRYRGKTSGGEITWIKKPHVDLRNRHVLIVDDILDEGRTLAAIQQCCLEMSPASLRIAVLCQKQHDRCVPGLKADYIGVQVPDRYVFGFGMDYYEQGRNLPGIYAV